MTGGITRHELHMSFMSKWLFCFTLRIEDLKRIKVIKRNCKWTHNLAGWCPSLGLFKS